jgi:hypothetical protein
LTNLCCTQLTTAIKAALLFYACLKSNLTNYQGSIEWIQPEWLFTVAAFDRAEARQEAFPGGVFEALSLF